jgi:ATP-dependent Clp protease adaptor protein ClpS
MSSDTTLEKKKTTSRKIQKPKKYKVIVCNDDVTPMDFVISMFMVVFKHDQQYAYDLTMTVHNQGRAVAGIYSYEIAEQKAIDGINLARVNGYPLLIKVEEE